ncbi:sensor histidine kinase [Paenibacillus sp. IB182496]|uniref:histidine kinase n=1 Tax=Paenibacillus sabuli TaxID=2772509 RepID=A0A927GRN4_9BACL|nr:sensor histidine kinase [Paenibacillus sabuli]MBD2844862.1 sensor histidine kinase [Paenibacillus sabuli]
MAKLRAAMLRLSAWSGGLLHRFTIPRPWLLAYLLLIVLPAAVFLYGYYARSSAILKSEVLRTMQQALKQAGSNLSYRLEHIANISDAAFMNAKLHEYLAVRPDDRSIATQIEVIRDLRYLVDTIQTNPDVFHMRLFVDSSKLYAEERVNFFTLDSLRGEPWYEAILADNGGIVWRGAYGEEFLGSGEARIFSAARMLRDPANYDRVSGVLMIDVRESMLAQIVSELQFAPSTEVYIADADGRIVYHPDRPRIGTAVPEAVRAALGGTDGLRTVSLDGQPYEVMHTRLEQAGWHLIAQGTEAQLSPQSVRLTRQAEWTSLIAYVALFLILPFLLLAIIVRGMNRRVHHVITAIRREGKDGRDGLRELPQVNGDFQMLERSVDHLILRVRTLVEEKYAAQLHEREAQLQALQAQINPHFLYNTLDTINWIAIGRGADDISQMIDSLAKYFRLSLNKGRSIVTVEDELQLVEVYLAIQQSRFQGTFEYVIDAEPGLEERVMPKLILQPIVENALLHGIRKAKDRQGRIVVAARRAQGDLLLTVTDNGIGMDEAQTRRLLTAAPDGGAAPTSGGSSYGLYNVNARIRLYAGEGYGLSVVSEPGSGTTVTVRLKADVPGDTGSAES